MATPIPLNSDPVTGSPEEVHYRCKAKKMNGLEEEIFASGTRDGINWACKFSTEFAFSEFNSEKLEKYVYVSWYFEWDELEKNGIKGLVGNITYWLKEQFEPTPIKETFRVDLTRSGQWIEKIIKENRNMQNRFSNCTLQFEFSLQPLVAYPDPEPLICSEMEDTVLKIGDNRVKVNRKFLSLHSDFFDGLFNSGLKETYEYEINIEDVNFMEFKLLLSIIHPTWTIPSDNSIDGVLSLAQRFLLPAAMKHIENSLLVHTRLSFNRIFLLADRYEMPRLLEKCIRCISSDKHLKYVKSYSEFTEFSKSTRERLEHHAKSSKPTPLTPQKKPGKVHIEKKVKIFEDDFYSTGARDDSSDVKWGWQLFLDCGIANNFESYETFVYSKFNFNFTKFIEQGFDGAEGFIEFFYSSAEPFIKERIVRQIELRWSGLDRANAEQVIEKRFRLDPFRRETKICFYGFRAYFYPVRGISHVSLPNQWTDATVTVEGHEFPVNTTILSANSTFFRNLFLRADSQVLAFTVNRGTKEQFAFLLDYIGPEPRALNDGDARKLHIAALRFGVRGVARLAENHFLFNPEMSLVSAIKTALALGMSKFLDKCMKKLQDPLLATCLEKSQGWKTLPMHLKVSIFEQRPISPET